MSKLAANLVQSCLRIRSEDNVTVFFYPHSLTLAEDIAAECFKVGADVLLNLYTDNYYSAYMRYLSEESLRQPSVFCRGLTELSTAQFSIGGPYDPAIYRRVSPEKMAADSEGETAAHWPLAKERKLRTLYVALGQVTRPRARAYGFPLAAWERMLREASSVKPEKLMADGQRLAGILDTADRVRIRGDGTDVEFSIAGRKTLVRDGVVDDADIEAGAFDAVTPDGAVVTSIVETSANGTVSLNVAQAWAGRSMRRLRWRFQDGRVVSWDGDAPALALKEQWEKATGNRDRIGQLTIGLNPKAKFGFLQNSIVRGSVSIGIGANDGVGGSNKSSFFFEHSLQGSTLEVDGKPLVVGGRLVAI